MPPETDGAASCRRQPRRGAKPSARPAPLRLTHRWNEPRLPYTGTAAAVTRIGLSLDTATLQSAQVVSWPWCKRLRGDALVAAPREPNVRDACGPCAREPEIHTEHGVPVT